MNGTELPPPPTFSLVQAGDKVVCLVLDVSSKMAEVTFSRTMVVKYSSFFQSVFSSFCFQRLRAEEGEAKGLE